MNRAALMPPRQEIEEAIALVEEARARLKGELVIDMVVPDYYARYPKPCAGGWGRIAINVSPTGKALPCHAAESDSGPRILERARSFARRHLAPEPGLRGVSRHGMDARALPLLRPARDRLGRLPLPGAGADRRRPQRPTRPATSRPSTSASSRRPWRSPNPAPAQAALAVVQGQGRGLNRACDPRYRQSARAFAVQRPKPLAIMLRMTAQT